MVKSGREEREQEVPLYLTVIFAYVITGTIQYIFYHGGAIARLVARPFYYWNAEYMDSDTVDLSYATYSADKLRLLDLDIGRSERHARYISARCRVGLELKSPSSLIAVFAVLYLVQVVTWLPRAFFRSGTSK